MSKHNGFRSSSLLYFVAAILALSASPVATISATPHGEKEAAPKSAAAQPISGELKRAELDVLLAHAEKIFVLDLRGLDEIAKIGTLPGYVNIPLAELESRLAEIPKNKLTLPVSNHAVRADKARAILEKHGYQVPGVVGVEDYQKDGGKLIFPAVKK